MSENEEKINDLIFDSVKKCMDTENLEDDVLVKICLGQATEEEKRVWQKSPLQL